MTAPQPGDRVDGLEWIGDTWTPVCPVDDVAMVDRDEQGWLCCGRCGVRAVDTVRPR